MKRMRGVMLSAALFSATCAVFGEKADPRTRTYVEPVRIVWTSPASAKSSVSNAVDLLKPKFGQTSEGRFLAPTGCRLVNNGEAPGILLDFGREIHGGVAIGHGMKSNMKARIRFGESVGEAMAPLGTKGAQKANAVRDGVYELPWLGTEEFGQTGFRFVRIDLVTPGTTFVESVRAVSLMRPLPPLGEFRCSDERLTRIWETAARTVKLCTQNYIWDGIKRDRLVWMGDMHPEICALLAAFGATEAIPDSLDYMCATTPPGAYANGAGTYTYWLVRGLREWWHYTGDLDWLRAHHDYLRKTLEFLSKRERADGHDTVGGLLDWPTHADRKAESDGAHALRVLAFRDGLEMARALDDVALADLCRATLARAKKPALDPNGQNSAAALMALAGLKDPKAMYDEVIGKNGISKFSTFYGYYMLEAMSAAGEDARAMAVLRDYWGGMLDMGATSFWEDFSIAWTNGATRIDEMPVVGHKDIHGDFGAYCYVGYRHSLCHGWSAGPAAWLSRHVLGVERVAPGGTRVRIRPALGDLAWAEGSVPLATGVLRVRHERRKDGSVDTKVLACPNGTKILAEDEPVDTVCRADFRIRDPFVLVDGGRYFLYESHPWSGGNGVFVRESGDLENWTEKTPAMTLPKGHGFTAIWAPEVHKFGGAYWLFVTLTEPKGTRPVKAMGLGAKEDFLVPRGTWIFKADSPRGPFLPVSNGPVTPREHMALDGTLYVEGGVPYMVYCHEWCQMGNGTIEYAPLADGFAAFAAPPKKLLDARSAMKGAGFVTDGPYFYRSAKSGCLFMIWSNVVDGKGYCVLMRHSESGKIAGPWSKDRLLYSGDGGHGMIFTALDGKPRLTLHQPNNADERMRVFNLVDDGKNLAILP